MGCGSSKQASVAQQPAAINDPTKTGGPSPRADVSKPSNAPASAPPTTEPVPVTAPAAATAPASPGPSPVLPEEHTSSPRMPPPAPAPQLAPEMRQGSLHAPKEGLTPVRPPRMSLTTSSDPQPAAPTAAQPPDAGPPAEVIPEESSPAAPEPATAAVPEAPVPEAPPPEAHAPEAPEPEAPALEAPALEAPAAKAVPERSDPVKPRGTVADVTPLDSEKEQLRSKWSPEYEVEGVRPVSKEGIMVEVKRTRTSSAMILEDFPMVCKTKVVCTLGPRCWSEDGIGALLDAGLNIARLNFSHGNHEDHQRVLDRFRSVCAEKGSHAAVLLDTKGPEIRTAMLRDGKDIELEAGQDITVVAVGDDYTTWEGFKDSKTGETKIGLSYAALCQSVVPGNVILLADGCVSIKVTEVLNEKELRGEVLNSKKLGQRKNGNLPGVKVDLPVLTAKDVDDIQQFGCKNNVDFVAASFVQTAEDVQLIRSKLDEAGGQKIQIISKIENEEGLKNYDDILRFTDGIMVARGDLGMEIPSEKVALAQKMMVTKANLAGKFVICATQMLENMVENPMPTRAEMTDVANAVFDGVDAVMLSGETANSPYFQQAASTMCAISSNAETTSGSALRLSWLRDFSQQPPSSMESFASSAVTACVESKAAAIVVITQTGAMARAVSKYRPPAPIIVVTMDETVARQTLASYGQIPCPVSDFSSLEAVMGTVKGRAEILGISTSLANVILLKGTSTGLDADDTQQISMLSLA